MTGYEILAILGLGVVSVITRSFFALSSRPWQFPSWVQSGLHYAPIAALAAVIAPEILTQNGQWITTWQDARPWATLAGAAWFYAKGGVLGTMLCGMAVYLPLHLGWGW